jgi:hypothetical protein
MEELLRLRKWIIVAIEDIIDEAFSDADHEQLTETKIILESLVSEFNNEVNTIISKRKQSKKENKAR